VAPTFKALTGTVLNAKSACASSAEWTLHFYINLEQAVFTEQNDEFHVKAVSTLDKACKLLEVGFEYVTDMDGYKLFRKRK
jgi:hypothetical protein